MAKKIIVEDINFSPEKKFHFLGEDENADILAHSCTKFYLKNKQINTFIKEILFLDIENNNRVVCYEDSFGNYIKLNDDILNLFESYKKVYVTQLGVVLLWDANGFWSTLDMQHLNWHTEESNRLSEIGTIVDIFPLSNGIDIIKLKRHESGKFIFYRLETLIDLTAATNVTTYLYFTADPTDWENDY